jgi:Ca2+-binding RTX toxin-like protein
MAVTGNDFIKAVGGGFDTLYGDEGDVHQRWHWATTSSMAAGNDSIQGAAAATILIAATATTISAVPKGVDTILGGDGDDIIRGALTPSPLATGPIRFPVALAATGSPCVLWR